MKILLVGAGTATSIRDVENGYAAALRDAGADIKLYALEARISLAQKWLFHQWRARGRIPDERPGWPEAIYRSGVEALEMALRFEVDWVLVISAMFLHPDVLILMRRAGLKVAVIFTESPYEDLAQLRLAQDVAWAWTTERTSVRTLRSGYLHHAYDPARHCLAEPDPDVPAHDVVFVGTGFWERCELLSAIDWTGIDLGLYGEWGLLGSRSKLRQFVRDGLQTNDQAIKLYRRAKVGLNLFRTSTGYGRGTPRITRAESANPRTFELAACGLFQISDYRPEVAEIFGSSIPMGHSVQELESLIRHGLAHPEWRQACAERAYQLVAPHNYAARAVQVLADLERSTAVYSSKGA